ncbi:MAG: hypothetical protein ITG00_01850, partial [Flavobacterium sp.]|nr:hypothetical protein [Flavobacterium sp.]
MKYVPLFITLFVCVFANAQALIVATDLDLKNPEHKQQFLQVKHPDSNEFFVFASDKTDFYALRFNGALFYRDSLKTARPANDVDFLAGSSFDAKGNPATYWVSEDYSTIRSTIFDFESRLINTALFKIDYKEQYFIGSFSTDGKFYIITTREDQDRLNFYVFTGGLMHESSVAIDIVFRKEQNQISFGKLLAQYPPEHIDNRLLTPLFYATPKIKFYTSNKKLLFTFDHELHQTQVVSVDLDSFESASSAIPNETLASGPGESNSFVSGELLYQLKANDT